MNDIKEALNQLYEFIDCWDLNGASIVSLFKSELGTTVSIEKDGVKYEATKLFDGDDLRYKRHEDKAEEF